MTITRDQLSNLAVADSASLSVTWGTNPAAGATVLLAVMTVTSAPTSVTDNGTSPSTFTEDASNTTAGNKAFIYRADNITLPASGSYTVTVDTASQPAITAAGISYLGMKSGGPTATNGNNAANNGPASTGSATPDSAGALAFALVADDLASGTDSIALTNASFTEQFTETDATDYITGSVADWINPAGPAGMNCTWTIGSGVTIWTAAIAVYDAATAPAPPSGSPFYPGVVIPVVSPISDGLNPVSTVMTVDWNVITRVSTIKTFQWDIPQYHISATKAIEFDTTTRIHKTDGIWLTGVDHPTVWAISYKSYVPAISWDADGRINTTVDFAWKNSARISSKKAIQFNILNYLFASKEFRFNDLKAVYVPGFVPPTWHNQVAQPVTHPISDATGQASSYFEWNVKYRTRTSIISRFNTNFATKVQKAFAFNDLALAVICQKAIEFHTYGEVNPELASSWHMNKRFYARHAISWETRHTLSKQLAAQWRVTNPVTKQKSFQFKTVQRLRLYKRVQFNFYKLTRARLPVEFHTLLHVVVRDWHLQSNSPSFLTTGIVHPIDYRNRSGIPKTYKGLCEPVVQPLDASVYTGSGQTATPGIQFRVGINPSGRVQCQKAIEFYDLNEVKCKQQSTWNLVNRMGKAILVSFSIYNYVVADMPTSWVTGAGTSSQIRQTAQVRTDFSY